MKNHIIIQKWFFESRKELLQESKEHEKTVRPGNFLPERNAFGWSSSSRTNPSRSVISQSTSQLPALIHVSGLGRILVAAARGCQQCEIFPDVHDLCLVFSLLTYWPLHVSIKPSRHFFPHPLAATLIFPSPCLSTDVSLLTPPPLCFPSPLSAPPPSLSLSDQLNWCVCPGSGFCGY